LPKKIHGKFDLVVCLANSISGVGSVAILKKSLRGFHDVLRPGGSLVLQLLNYASIKEGEVRPIRVTENEGIVYGRYSIRRGKKLAVHVIRLDMNDNPPKFEPFCHEFENFDPDQITKAVKVSGFVSLRKYADLYLSKRFAKSSRDLVVIASRPKR
jgi:SAM-dependent methyltransferase